MHLGELEEKKAAISLWAEVPYHIKVMYAALYLICFFSILSEPELKLSPSFCVYYYTGLHLIVKLSFKLLCKTPRHLVGQ